MLSAADVEVASGMLARIEDHELRRTGATMRDARRAVARRVGAGPGTVTNIRIQRRQTIPSYLMERIRAVLIDILQSEMRALEHEIAIARQTGVDHRDDALEAAEAHMVEAKAILEGAVR